MIRPMFFRWGRGLVCAIALVSLTRGVWPQNAAAGSPGSMSAVEIVEQMRRHNQAQTEGLKHYEALRHYSQRDLTFRFVSDDVTCDGESLYPARSRDDNLAYPFHRDGVRGLTLSGVRLETDEPDGRHALALDDVDDADISGLIASHSHGAAAIIGLLQTRNAMIRGCRPDLGDDAFLRLAGKDTADISLIGNDLRRVGRIAEFAEQADSASLQIAGSLLPKNKDAK